MNSLSAMNPTERAKFGAATVRNAAFDAVQALWRRRNSENWTRKRAADSIGRDEGWFSKQFTGPRNWTMETFGALIQSLDGEVEIVVHAIEDVAQPKDKNWDAYAEMEDLPPRRTILPTPKKDDIAPVENTQKRVRFDKGKLYSHAPI